MNRRSIATAATLMIAAGALLISVGYGTSGRGVARPPLAATDVIAVAPLPGADSGVVYLTLENRGADPITIHRVSSPEFTKAEIHETELHAGVVRMRRLGSLKLDPRTHTELAPGGRHLMLIGPARGLAPGDPVTIRFEYDAGGLLIVSARLGKRR